MEISAKEIFVKEKAGSKETKIDTTILQSKINRSIADVLSENSSVLLKIMDEELCQPLAFEEQQAHIRRLVGMGSISAPL